MNVPYNIDIPSIRRHQLSNIEPNLLGGNGNVDPPESISNSEVKRVSADGSVGAPMRE